jgi:hypothetical protein
LVIRGTCAEASPPTGDNAPAAINITTKIAICLNLFIRFLFPKVVNKPKNRSNSPRMPLRTRPETGGAAI